MTNLDDVKSVTICRVRFNALDPTWLIKTKTGIISLLESINGELDLRELHPTELAVGIVKLSQSEQENLKYIIESFKNRGLIKAKY